MKLKQIFILVLIIILSGVIFYLGWIQIQLPENTYGVAFTKSSGYLDQLYEPGKFSWNIQKVLPGNFKLLKFKLFTQYLEINESGQLPSGNIYSEYISGTPDFSYEFNYYLTYCINLKIFSKMVSDLALTPDDMDKKYNELNGEIELFISNFYKNKFLESNYSANTFYNVNDSNNELLNSLTGKFPSLVFINLVPVQIILPDAVLYIKAKEIYLSSITLQNKIISESKLKIAEQEIIDNANFETLKKYGELLNQYPSLIDLFSVLDINSEGIFPKLNIENSEDIIE